jgi:Phosphotransferase enzyme family
VRTLAYVGLETRRIILLRILTGGRPEVLLGLEGTHRTLPQLQIPRWQRVAEYLTAAFKETCGIDAVSVSSVETHPAESGSEQITYEIMEPHVPRRDEAPRDKHWVAVDSLVESGFHDPNDFQALRQAVAQSIACGEDPFPGPFARLGWFHELEEWVQEKIGPQGLHLNGRFRQLNAYPMFSLIRFETEGPAVWFKAVGVPNRRELPLTLTLARLFSCSIPEIIATRSEWGGWLSREAVGSLLTECSTLGAWEAAARDLAELQIHSLGRSVSLLDLGAHDLRARALAEMVEPFFCAMGEATERQTNLAAALSREQLCCLSGRVQHALAALENTGFSDTLGHLDLNPGNIVYSPSGSVFLDWAEAFVGHPFLTFEYLLEHFRRVFGQDHAGEAQLVTHYSSRWCSFVCESDIRRALDVAPLVAVFAYATGNRLWMEQRRLQEPWPVGNLLSLTRRMERESHALSEERVPCRFSC